MPSLLKSATTTSASTLYAVDGEVERLGIAKGVGGGVGRTWSDSERDGIRSSGVKGSGKLMASGYELSNDGRYSVIRDLVLTR